MNALAVDVDNLRTESRKGIAAVAAMGAVAAGGGGPGEVGVDVGVAGYKGQGAVATNISYTTEGGVVVNAGVAYAGSGTTVARVGIGMRFKLGSGGAKPVSPASGVAPSLTAISGVLSGSASASTSLSQSATQISAVASTTNQK